MNNLIYLDNAATTRPCDAALAAVNTSLIEAYFNPSASYTQGLYARKSLDACRTLIQSALKAHSVLFTSGGTEANNLAILGSMAGRHKRGKVLYLSVEHSAVAATCQSLAKTHDVHAIPVDGQGLINLDAAREMMDEDTALICVMQVNNEVGSVQPLQEVIRLRDERCPDAFLHVDGVQGFLRLPVSLCSGIDSYALSAHKVHGIKGCGALALTERIKLKPQLFGGGQEGGLRAGTENTAGVAALEAAIRDYPQENSLYLLKNRLKSGLLSLIPEATVNGPDTDSTQSCSHILNMSFPPVRAQTMLNALEARGVLVSQGSACSSGSTKPSRTLQAMGLHKERTDSALRFSLGRFTTSQEIDTAVDLVWECYQELKQFTRR